MFLFFSRNFFQSSSRDFSNSVSRSSSLESTSISFDISPEISYKVILEGILRKKNFRQNPDKNFRNNC